MKTQLKRMVTYLAAANAPRPQSITATPRYNGPKSLCYNLQDLRPINVESFVFIFLYQQK